MAIAEDEATEMVAWLGRRGGVTRVREGLKRLRASLYSALGFRV